MPSSSGQCTCLRPFLLGNLLMLGFILLLVTYINPNMDFPSFGVYLRSMGLPSRPVTSCSHWANQDNSTLESDNETHHTTLLIWTWPFQYKFDSDCGVFGVQKCHLTDDRSIYNKADGVFFHHRDIRWQDLPKIPRPCFQKWVWTNMESPDNVPRIPRLDDLFNLTCNYRLDANIPVPYGYLVPRNSEDPDFQLPAKDKLVCWIVSNWNRHLLRVQYYNQLKDHIQISTYGKVFGNPLSEEDFKNVVSSCKFYLAFENSVHKDYITEKLFRPMSLGSVPIVLGPPRENYLRQIPADSFIHVNDFASPKELADRLHHLNKNPEEYMRYFKWTKESKVTFSWFGKEHACRTCGYIQNNRRSEVCRSLTEWFWD